MLVELQARFDEQRNIAWARQLEESGVHVVYGVVGLKTHSKTALVVRREADGIRRYCHIGTGNYNSDTARIYEDLGSVDRRSGARRGPHRPFQPPDRVLARSRPAGSSLRRPASAPGRSREIARERDARRAGPDLIKVNGLMDPVVIDVLDEASQAGVRIDLLVRGLRCLRPGIPGLSSTITVRSVVGRYLEHSRIYRFGVPAAEVLAATALARGRTWASGPATRRPTSSVRRTSWSATSTGGSRRSCRSPAGSAGGSRTSSRSSRRRRELLGTAPRRQHLRVATAVGLCAQTPFRGARPGSARAAVRGWRGGLVTRRASRLDLGSNSFHMIVVDTRPDGSFAPLDPGAGDAAARRPLARPASAAR